jgi:hypothetical protein
MNLREEIKSLTELETAEAVKALREILDRSHTSSGLKEVMSSMLENGDASLARADKSGRLLLHLKRGGEMGSWFSFGPNGFTCLSHLRSKDLLKQE